MSSQTICEMGPKCQELIPKVNVPTDLIKELCAIDSCTSHQFILTARMEVQVCRNVIHTAYKYRKHINSLAPGRFEWNFRWIFIRQSVIYGLSFCCEVVLRWMSLDLSDDKSTMVQVMAWCHQATSHYLSQCWPRFMSPYGVSLGHNELKHNL